MPRKNSAGSLVKRFSRFGPRRNTETRDAKTFDFPHPKAFRPKSSLRNKTSTLLSTRAGHTMTGRSTSGHKTGTEKLASLLNTLNFRIPTANVDAPRRMEAHSLLTVK